MPKWLQVVVAVGVCAISASLAYMAFWKPSAIDRAQQSEAVVVAANMAVEADMLAQAHHERFGRYAWLHEIKDNMPGWEAFFVGSRPWELSLRASPDGNAYLAVADFSREAGVECAAHRSGPESPDDRVSELLSEVDLGTWRLEADGMVRCRRTGLPWSALHRLGVGYLDVEQAMTDIGL